MSRNEQRRGAGISWLVGLGLLAGTVVCYWPMRQFEFIGTDDPEYVSENPVVAKGLTWPGLVWAFKNTEANNWHPVTWLSHMLDCQLFGLSPGAHHLSNLVFHCANTVLLFLLLRRMTGAVWRSALVSALFAWHPLHVESIAWISERKDVLSAFFFLLTVWAYCQFALKPNSVPERPITSGIRTGSHPRRYYLLCLGFFALGLMSKPMVVTLPFVLLLLDFWPLRRNAECGIRSAESGSGRSVESGKGRFRPAGWGRLLVEKLPFFALALAACVVAFWAQKSGGAMRSMAQVPLILRLENSLVAYATYLGKLFWPSHLAIFYPYPAGYSPGAVCGAGVLLAAVSATAIWLRGRQPCLLTGWFWFVGTLVPVIGLVQVGEQAWADRYAYIPYIGLFIMAAWGVPALIGARRWRAPALGCAAAVVLAACLVSTRVQVMYWRNSVTLFQHAVEATAGNYTSENNLGVALVKQERLEEAEPHFLAALRMKPDLDGAHYNLGLILSARGELEAAAGHFRELVRLKPQSPDAWNLLGKAYFQQQKLNEAERAFAQSVQVMPGFADGHYNLAFVHGVRGEMEACAAEVEQASRLSPTDAGLARKLGEDLARMGKREEAARLAEVLAHPKHDGGQGMK